MNQLQLEYRKVSSGPAAECALALSNSILIAERLESSTDWGVFKKRSDVQTRAILKAWQIVNQKRIELNNLVNVTLSGIVEKMKQDETNVEKVDLFENDLAIKSKLCLALGKGSVSESENLALLSAWAVLPFEN